jgi:cytochrome bd-type quinol oxidase subunit 2
MKALQFLAVVLTALALVPGGAHLLAMPNKLGLDETAYFAAQEIYRGWALFGVVLVAAIAADLALAIGARRQRAAFWPALIGALCLVATLAVFFLWTYPANQATSDWTAVPDDWQGLRQQWEYSHAGNAVLTFLALCLVTLSTLRWQPATARRSSAPAATGR